MVMCGRCNGEGVIRSKVGFIPGRRECLGCGGTGQVPRVPCKVCEGAGLVAASAAPRGVLPNWTGGTTQRCRARARRARGEPLGRPATVIMRVRPHPFFGREGDVLTIDLPISPVEAALGTEVEVPVLDGRVQMRVPAGTQAGSVFRLRGRGLPREGGRGDAHVRIVVETPAAVSDEARALLTRVGELLDDESLPRRRAFREAAQKPRTGAGGGAEGAS